MRASMIASGAVLVLLNVAAVRAGSVTIEVIPSLAPNITQSSSTLPYASNAIYAIQQGLTSYGSGAAAYNVAPGSMPIMWNISSMNFQSWMGVASPNVPTYVNEYGNYLLFGVHIDGGGAQFSVADVGLELTSDDPGHIFNTSYGPGVMTYGVYYVGLNYGPDGVKGGGDDIYVTSPGDNTVLVNEFFGVGFGEALGVVDNGVDPLQEQILNRARATTTVPINFTATYSLTIGRDTTQGSATVELLPVVPLPSAAGMGIFGLIGVGLLGRRYGRAKVAGESLSV